MSRIFNLYQNDLDRAWYSSSNIVYSECDDKENELKVLRVVFSTGRMYQYEGVNVFDYLKFRDSDSQGKAFNQYIRKYDAKRLEDADLDKIQKELDELNEPGVRLNYEGDTFKITSPDGTVLFDANRVITDIESELLENVLKAIDVQFKTVGKNKE